MDLHVYTDEFDSVIAKDLPDAFAVFKEHSGIGPDEFDQEDWYQVPDGQEVRIYQGDGCMAKPEDFENNSIAKTAAEWATERGRGFLCSTEC